MALNQTLALAAPAFAAAAIAITAWLSYRRLMKRSAVHAEHVAVAEGPTLPIQPRAKPSAKS